MKNLYVGCKVRVVWSRHFPQYVGRETRIIGPLQEFYSDFDLESYEGFPVEIDEGFAPKPEQLEPIIPEGHQVVSWSECLWQPQGEVA